MGTAVAKRTDRNSIFAIRLAQARERAGLSQKQLGILAGMDPAVASPRINQYERGRHEPQARTAKELAEVLGVPPAFLYTDDELLAELLLRWGDLSLKAKKQLLKEVQAESAKKVRGTR